jgi:hypothetical protein
MIVAVKRNKKQKFVKLLSLVVLVAMFAGYYYHMNKTYEEQQKVELEEKIAKKAEEDKKEKAKKEVEKAIISEVEKAVDLVGQEHIRHVKLIENKIVIVCEPDTNLDALMVRYGVMALIKRTLNEIVIAVDVNFILKSKLDEK